MDATIVVCIYFHVYIVAPSPSTLISINVCSATMSAFTGHGCMSAIIEHEYSSTNIVEAEDIMLNMGSIQCYSGSAMVYACSYSV